MPPRRRETSRIGAIGRALRGDVRPGQNPHRLGEAGPILPPEPLGLLKPLPGPLEPLSVDLDPAAPNEREPVRAGQKRLHLGGGQGLATSMGKSSSASVPRPAGASAPTVAVTRGGGAAGPPDRGHAYHDARVLQLGDIAEEAEGLRHRPAQRSRLV